jgi:hypothetical protein
LLSIITDKTSVASLKIIRDARNVLFKIIEKRKSHPDGRLYFMQLPQRDVFSSWIRLSAQVCELHARSVKDRIGDSLLSDYFFFS